MSSPIAIHCSVKPQGMHSHLDSYWSKAGRILLTVELVLDKVKTLIVQARARHGFSENSEK